MKAMQRDEYKGLNIVVEMMSQLTHLTEEEKLSIEESFPIKPIGKVLTW
ncbi:MAG: hypothetical protein JNM78_03160 [Cyclobacteriaceae bacterium]|nr:hypothetical protein [Cyclobacteriaceae bacterium]